MPTSESSKNAFIVKYCKRKQPEIARRIFIASTASIEHVTPASSGGINSIGNFLKQSDAYSYIKVLYEYGKITKREANIIFAAVSDTTLNTDAQLKDYLRARILKNILINLKRS